MSDLKTPWQSGGFYANESTPVMPMETDLGGDLVTARGGDPLITDGQKETANSVSGLPLQPARFLPNDTPPAPPSLEDRMPGTIDQPTRSSGGVKQ